MILHWVIYINSFSNKFLKCSDLTIIQTILGWTKHAVLTILCNKCYTAVHDNRNIIFAELLILQCITICTRCFFNCSIPDYEIQFRMAMNVQCSGKFKNILNAQKKGKYGVILLQQHRVVQRNSWNKTLRLPSTTQDCGGGLLTAPFLPSSFVLAMSQ